MVRVWFAGRRAVQSIEDRARGLARHFSADLVASHDYRDGRGVLASTRAFFRTLAAARRHDVLWLLSQHPARVIAAWLGRALFDTRIVVDTGDLLYESVRIAGRPPLYCAVVRVLEALSTRVPDAMVVRGSQHVTLLQRQGVRRVELIVDGVECHQFARRDSAEVRARLGVPSAVTVGVIATIGWEARLGLPSPGWDVVECLARLPDLDVVGLVVGDGPGLAGLRALADQRGVTERMRFVGRVPLAELPGYLSGIDIFLHTALNNPMSAVRTTGKLPIFLASGCAAVVSRVGEAARVLEGTGMLIDFDGTWEEYARRLAARVRAIIADGELERWRETGPAIARREFDYAALGVRAEALVRALTGA
jgi:glycosyltransferase involved in cell wall biosynthesis